MRFLALFCFNLLFFSCVEYHESLRIAAASDLKFALDSVLVEYRKEYPELKLEVSYGSSGKWCEQIRNGAPYDLFFSADEKYVSLLQKEGKTLGNAYIYGHGRVCLWIGKEYSAYQISDLTKSEIHKIAIANPEHAPYGKRAVQILQKLNLFDSLKSKLVYAENIVQSAEYKKTGAVDAAFIAQSLAITLQEKEEGSFILVRDSLHEALIQSGIILKSKNESTAAQNFFHYIKEEKAKAILKYYGFQ